MAAQTRFFCRCGRLLTVDASTRELVCPTCHEVNSVPHLGSASPARLAGPSVPSPSTSPSPSASSTAVLGQREGHRLDRFELLRVLGQGGMGTVWLARDVVRGGDVALKVLHPALQARPDFLSRFQREARAASSLDHPNIVRLLDSGVERGTPWIAMELVEGDELLAAVQHGLLDVRNVVPVMLQATRGLLAAAEVGITHRDVKPGNLLLRKDGIVKVADFGLAKAVDSSSHLTVTGEILGTPHYMAPEQGRGERVDHRADLYSLGATFYHVLGGAPPHEADTPVAVIMKHLREEPLPLRVRNPQVSLGLERVIHRLLQKSPEQRYQTHAALIDDLERVGAGRDPIGGAEPPLRRVKEGGTTWMLPHESTTEFVLQPAGTLRRCLALLVDLVAVEVLLRVLLVASSALLGLRSAAGRSVLQLLFTPTVATEGGWRSTTQSVVCLLAALLYFAASDARGGRTVGKKWLSLRVCRRDGTDLGMARALLRTLLLVPGIVMISPTLVGVASKLLAIVGVRAEAAPPQVLLGAGFAWLVVLELLGRMSALGRSLHDGAADAVTYRAQRSTDVVRLVPTGDAAISPTRALRLSVVPGLGVMYAGQMLLGLGFLAATVWCFIESDDLRVGLAVWSSSAFAAHALARRRRRRAPTPTAVIRPPPDDLIRRQES